MALYLALYLLVMFFVSHISSLTLIVRFDLYNLALLLWLNLTRIPFHPKDNTSWFSVSSELEPGRRQGAVKFPLALRLSTLSLQTPVICWRGFCRDCQQLRADVQQRGRTDGRHNRTAFLDLTQVQVWLVELFGHTWIWTGVLNTV